MKPYYASLPAEELCQELTTKIDNYLQWCLITGRIARWRMAYDSYYGQRDSHNSSYVSAAGEQGELSFLMANEYRNLVQHVLVMTTQNKTSFEAATTNTDAASQEAGILAKRVLDYYLSLGGVGATIYQALECALVMDHSWVFNEWAINKGTEVRPDEEGNMMLSGDIESSFKMPIDVVIDYMKDASTPDEWQIKADLVNKYDLAAQYPEKAEDIIGLNRDLTKNTIYRFGDQGVYAYNTGDSPFIQRWTFYHKVTPAMPRGRMFQFLNAKLWLFDGPIPYSRLPGRRVCPNEQLASSMGYSNMNDLLSLQDVLDSLVSSAVTNMTSCGVNNIWAKTNSNMRFDRLAEGMNYLESDEKPEVLILNRLSPEWFNLADWIVGRMESYSGINSVSRGNTEGKDMSGAAMALLQSMAIQFNSGMQRAYNKISEDVGNDIVENLQKFGKEDMTAFIAGEHDSYMVESFTGAKLEAVKRVFVKQSNSIQDTAAGKLTLFDNLMKIPNAITRPEQGIAVMTTGRLEPSYEDKEKELLCIRKENELLAKGQAVPVIFTEMHPMHIDQHRYLTLDLNKKQDPTVLQAVDAHMREHLTVWSQTDPLLLQAMGIPPFPMPPMLPMGVPPGGTPPNGEGPIPLENPVEGQPNQPNMPINPLSNQPFNPETGGM